MSYELRLLAFDADDTLWDCQSHFVEVEREYCDILADYGDAEAVSNSLFAVETSNMPLMGYGCKAFVISLVENALKISHGQITADKIGRIVEIGKSLLDIDAKPLPEVEQTLKALKDTNRYKMVMFTKGELLDQENKLRRSGLGQYLDGYEIVADKTPETFLALCRHNGVEPSEMAMIGNSFKSDIAPALKIGARAFHIPFHVMWKLEQTAEYGHPNLVRLSHFGELVEKLQSMSCNQDLTL